jgi:hypothetical protein
VQHRQHPDRQLRQVLHVEPSGNLDHADMYGYLDISKHIHTKPRPMDNFHAYVPRIWISWISKLDVQMDIHCGYPSYPNSHQVDHHGITTVIRSGKPSANPYISVVDHQMDIHMDIFMVIHMVIHSDNYGYTFGCPS